jgi:hypothetical protein
VAHPSPGGIVRLDLYGHRAARGEWRYVRRRRRRPGADPRGGASQTVEHMRLANASAGSSSSRGTCTKALGQPAR